MDEAATSAPQLYEAFVRYVALQVQDALLWRAWTRCLCCAQC